MMTGAAMTGRTVLITGGTGGIGRATALGLARLGANVAITGRDPARAENTAHEIRSETGVPVDVFLADLSAQAEVRRLAPRLRDGDHARVVTVASHAHAQGRIDFDDLQSERAYSGARAYNQSKLANILFNYELARRLQGSAVTANAVHPGIVSTSFGVEDPGRTQRLLVPVLRPFMKSAQRGAATSIHVASARQLQGVTGRYFTDSRPRTSSARSRDQEAAARLWQASTGLVGC
jgi:retinol dehydrogenase 14